MARRHSNVVQMAGWRSTSRDRPKLLALGAGLEFTGGEPLKFELAKRRHRAPRLPVAEVALADAHGSGGSDLRLEMLDDLVVGHMPDYRAADIGMSINSHNDRGTIQEMEAINERIRRLRKAAGLTQIDFAKAIGVAQSTVSEIENGANFEASTLMAISKALLKSPQYVMTGVEEALELSDVEAKMISAFRQAQPKEDKGPSLKKTAEDKAVSSPMSKPKTKRRAA